MIEKIQRKPRVRIPAFWVRAWEWRGFARNALMLLRRLAGVPAHDAGRTATGARARRQGHGTLGPGALPARVHQDDGVGFRSGHRAREEVPSATASRPDGHGAPGRSGTTTRGCSRPCTTGCLAASRTRASATRRWSRCSRASSSASTRNATGSESILRPASGGLRPDDRKRNGEDPTTGTFPDAPPVQSVMRMTDEEARKVVLEVRRVKLDDDILRLDRSLCGPATKWHRWSSTASPGRGSSRWRNPGPTR